MDENIAFSDTSNDKSQLEFLSQILQATSESNANPQVIYPLLKTNQDKLNKHFASVFRNWAEHRIPNENPDLKQFILDVIAETCILIKQFPSGNKVDLMEISIAGEEIIAEFLKREEYPKQWAINQINLGNSYDERLEGEEAENREIAIRHYLTALQILTRRDFPEPWAATKGNLGVAYCKRIYGNQIENVEQGIAAIKDALRVYTCKDFPMQWAFFQKNLGWAYQKRIKSNPSKKLAAAINAYKLALQVYTCEDFPKEWADIQVCLGDINTKLRKLDEALFYYRSAIKTYEVNGFYDDCRQTAMSLGYAAFNEKCWNEAIEGYSIAIECIEKVRIRDSFSHGLDNFAFTYSAAANECYNNIIQACINANNYFQAYEYVQRCKTCNLNEILLFKSVKNIEKLSPLIAQKYVKLLTEIEVEQRRINVNKIMESNNYITGSVEYTALDRLRQSLNNLVEKRIKPLIPNFNPITSQFEPITFSNISTLLADKHTAIIEWHITNDSLLTFIIFPEHKHIFPHPPSNFKVLQSSSEKLQEIYNFINEYTQEYLYNQNSWNYKFTKYLDILAELLEINKILSYISNDCNQLILVPHLFLRLFPLHALPVNSKNRFGSCLLERFKRGIRYIASCQLQQQIEKRKNVEFNNIFAFQNPSGDLEYANLEVNAIKADFQSSQIYVQAQAKKEAINNDRLRDFHCIHFACHGRFSFEGGVDSTILLADEKLSLWEIFDLQLHKCRLVTLSACETGLTDVQYSRMYGVDDCYGLHSSFLIAGASSVVSSLWVVNDISTAFLMIRFYQNLHTGLSVALALNTAQIWLRDITTAQLHKWACQLKLTAEFKQHINQTLDWFDDHEKPFQNPLYWAAFYAIGQ